MKLVTVSEMQTIEKQADANGLSYAEMMENAGRGLAETILLNTVYGELQSALGLVGSGNNGGDTLVALAHLARQGWQTAAYLLRPRPENDPLVARLREHGGQVITPPRLGAEYPPLPELLSDYNLLLDGVLGTGMRLPLKPELADDLGAVKAALAGLDEPPFVVAVDCPSGVDCDSGAAAGQTLAAGLTVTMAAVKAGLLSFPAFGLCGEIEVVPIGDLRALPGWKALQRSVMDEETVSGLLPARPLDAHKGTFGTLLGVLGSLNYTGAALLAGEAAYRIGAGLVTLAVPAPLHAALAGQLPEATWLLLSHADGFIAAEAAGTVLQAVERATALLVGPGFGLQPTTAEFLARLLEGSPNRPPLPPMVMDADGLKLLARLPDWPARLPAGSVLTPHPGEMAVLTGLERDAIQADRLAIAERYARQWGQVVILKGALSIVAAPDGRTAFIPVASAALARAGTGDVLAGLVAGLLAQGLSAFDAARAGAWIHAQAGLAAAAALGNDASVLAGDVLASIPDVLAGLL